VYHDFIQVGLLSDELLAQWVVLESVEGSGSGVLSDSVSESVFLIDSLSVGAHSLESRGYIHVGLSHFLEKDGTM
jgi:hypothetical protein